MEPIRGSCLCGAVAYELTAPPTIANHCHCSRCRKARGAAQATNLLVPLDGLRFVRGEARLTLYRVPDARHFAHVFCQTCGASMPRRDDERGFAIVPMGSLDDDPGIRPSRHIFVDSRAPWDQLTDELPKYPGAPPRN